MDSLISRLNNAVEQQKTIVAIFDIDSTLFNVTPRNQSILDLFVKLNPFITQDTAIKLTLEEHDWGIEDFLTQLTSKELKYKAKTFWKKHFFSGTFLLSDRPYTGSRELVDFFKHQEGHIYYLTGRDNERMREGTLAQLRHWDFPLGKDEDLITKPHRTLPDGEYKSSELEALIARYPESDYELCFFDNEPAVLQHCIFQDTPHYSPVFIDSTHSRRSEPEDHWLTLPPHRYYEFISKLKGV